jgi:predicted  nucleic acid-binding Zn-ribbon protein
MKTIEQKGLIILTALAAGATVLLNGCGTTSGYKQADKTGAGIADFREEIVNGKAAIDNTMKALSDVAASADSDPRKAFEEYSKNVSNLESTADKIRKRAQSMREQGQTYFKQWEEQLASVNNPEIRSLAEQRKAKLQETFESVRKHTEPLKAQFDPWMSDLKDLQKYLSQDLTIAGVDAAKGMFAKATSGGLEVQKSMDGLVAELNTIAATITPSKVEKK